MAYGFSLGRKIMRQILWAAAMMGTSLPTAGHASPSFDCHQASAPIEVLICANPDLAALDENLATAFQADIQAAAGDVHTALLAGQRSWLLQREPACRIPPEQVELHIDEWNVIADCVSRLYRERIEELRPHAAVSDVSVGIGGLVHPRCLGTVLWSIWNQDPPARESFPLKECIAENAEVPVSVTRGLFSAHAADQPAYYEYKPNAIMPDGRQLFVVYDGGGTGQGSQVAVIWRTHENGETMVHGSTVVEGRDRCGGSISAVTPDGAGVFVDLDVNPSSFLGFAGLRGGSGASVGYNDCIGTIRVRVPLNHIDDSRWVETVSGMVKSDTSGMRVADGNHCFDVAVSEIPGALPKKLDRPALGQLAKSYEACFAKAPKNIAQ